MDELCDLMKGDFMKIPSGNETFDAVYQIEATAHAPSKEGVYAEIFRVMKPGGKLTTKFDMSSNHIFRLLWWLRMVYD